MIVVSGTSLAFVNIVGDQFLGLTYNLNLAFSSVLYVSLILDIDKMYLFDGL